MALIDIQRKVNTIPDGQFGPMTAKAIMGFLKLTPEEAAHFLGQAYLESGGFKKTVESLNYSKEGLLKVFGKYFDSETAERYARKPEMIANRVYGNRMGNGPEESWDGWKYRGRGFIQLTGKNNYSLFCNQMSDPAILAYPDIVSEKYSLESARFYFDTNGIWKWCREVNDRNIKAVSSIINLGRADHPATPNHLNERNFHTKRIYKWLTG